MRLRHNGIGISQFLVEVGKPGVGIFHNNIIYAKVKYNVVSLLLMFPTMILLEYCC